MVSMEHYLYISWGTPLLLLRGSHFESPLAKSTIREMGLWIRGRKLVDNSCFFFVVAMIIIEYLRGLSCFWIVIITNIQFNLCRVHQRWDEEIGNIVDQLSSVGVIVTNEFSSNLKVKVNHLKVVLFLSH